MIEVSVIVPVYNASDYLRRCINSILEQTFKNFELILIDDGSMDDSGEICDELQRLIIEYVSYIKEIWECQRPEIRV